jgi:hypothetical protein
MDTEEYIIINKTAIQKRIEELEKISPLDRLCYDGMIECEERVLKEILFQSTPLIPEIEKAFKQGELTASVDSGDIGYKSKQDYITNLKLKI